MSEVLDGRVWRCLGTGCCGQSMSAPRSQSLMSECRRVAARLGALTRYRSGGRELGAAELVQCNAAAPRRDSGVLVGGR